MHIDIHHIDNWNEEGKFSQQDALCNTEKLYREQSINHCLRVSHKEEPKCKKPFARYTAVTLQIYCNSSSEKINTRRLILDNIFSK